MGFLVFCNVKENGEIDDCVTGERVIPEKGYDYFFFLPEEVDVAMMKVVNGELVNK